MAELNVVTLDLRKLILANFRYNSMADLEGASATLYLADQWFLSSAYPYLANIRMSEPCIKDLIMHVHQHITLDYDEKSTSTPRVHLRSIRVD